MNKVTHLSAVKKAEDNRTDFEKSLVDLQEYIRHRFESPKDVSAIFIVGNEEEGFDVISAVENSTADIIGKLEMAKMDVYMYTNAGLEDE